MLILAVVHHLQIRIRPCFISILPIKELETHDFWEDSHNHENTIKPEPW